MRKRECPAGSAGRESVMRLLVVEDEEKTANFLRRGLEENGFVVDVAGRGDDGLHLARTVCRRAERSVVALMANSGSGAGAAATSSRGTWPA